LGIVVGTSDTAFGIDQYALQAEIESGSSAGEFAYTAMAVGVATYTSTTDTWKITHTRIYNNNSGGSITVKDKKAKTIHYDIRETDVLISGGAGVDDMKELEVLATLLKGDVSASRSVVDKGMVSRALQVGQSGKTVSPTLYIALGIHGALQHVEGLKDVSYIISVNTNRNAPICSISDIVVEGDALTFVQRLVKRIEKGQQL
jgi:electron transfer flavoprotein alpha subunit